MSLIVSGKNNTIVEPIQEGNYVAICIGLYDIGDQYSEKFDKSQRKVILSWELPEIKYLNKEGMEQSKIISKTYTASLGERASLRKDLESWRGKTFTFEELDAFDLNNILRKTCMLQIVNESNGDKTYSNIKAVTTVHKSISVPSPTLVPVAFDLDAEGWQAEMTACPEWVQTRIKDSLTYKDRLNAAEKAQMPWGMGELLPLG